MSRYLIEGIKKALRDELFSSVIYGRLALMHKSDAVARKFSKLAEVENSHARFWVEFLRRRGVVVKDFRVSKFKVFMYSLLFRLLGLGLTLKILEVGEQEAIKLYSTLLESRDVSEDEREGVVKILEDELIHEHEFIDEESRFKEFINHVRDAVLGMSDGLVEVLSVSAGLAGVYGEPLSVALGGTIVGVAGALSMGIGAFSSVRAQRQVRLGAVERIRLASKYVAHVLTSRVMDYMVRRGFTNTASKTIAEEASRNRDILSRIVIEEEYGIREEVLEDPIKAGLYTGIFYMIGAVTPLLPYYLLLPVTTAVILSLTLSAVLFVVVGFIVAISANISIKKKVLELLLEGLGAAGVTFLIGRLASLLLGIEVS